MGEFHYTRYPRAYWEEELRKIKAAGVQILATYVFWNHHEERAGEFNWNDERDLRAFVDLCGRLGFYVVVRLGPWAHGEARIGGTPDWVVTMMPTRRNDATYLQYTERFWRQVGQQLQGRLWKEGGAIIGVQLENEYNLAGEGRGPEQARNIQAAALAQLPMDACMELHGPLGLTVMLAGISRLLVMENALGISLGHKEAKLVVERWIHRLQEPSERKPRASAVKQVDELDFVLGVDFRSPFGSGMSCERAPSR